MKKLIMLCAIAATSLQAMAQNTASNFNVNDCNGNPRELYADLNAGKVVVLVWVMPCGACTGPSKTAYNIAKSYSSSHPGIVKYYMIDDYANSSCASLSGWANNNNIYPDAVFSNSNISMSDYGSDGMPKIVIAAGSSHKIFFNENNSASGNSTALQSAMQQALSHVTGIKKSSELNEQLRIFPNPASEKISVSFFNESVSDVKIEIFQLSGACLQSNLFCKQPASQLTYEVQLADLPKGIYYLSVNGNFRKLSII